MPFKAHFITLPQRAVAYIKRRNFTTPLLNNIFKILLFCEYLLKSWFIDIYCLGIHTGSGIGTHILLTTGRLLYDCATTKAEAVTKTSFLFYLFGKCIIGQASKWNHLPE